MDGCSHSYDDIDADEMDDAASSSYTDRSQIHHINTATEKENDERSSVAMVDTEAVASREETNAAADSSLVHTLDVSAIGVVLREMGMYIHFTETIQRSPLKTVSTINHFSSFLLFVNQSLGWDIDVSKLVDEVDKLIEHVISKGYMQVGRFCIHLSTVR